VSYKTIRLKLTPAQVESLGQVAVGRALAAESRNELLLWTKIAAATGRAAPRPSLTRCPRCDSRPCCYAEVRS
jgi:hypothetical protein